MDIADGIIGQRKAVDTLIKFYNSGRIPHAFLFSGIEGIGKHSVALWFAKLLNSENENPKTIGHIESLSEPYVKYIIPLPRGKGETPEDNPIAKLSKDDIENIQREIQLKSVNPYHKIVIENANNIKITSIRDNRKFLSLSYDDVKYRFILINDAHLMTVEAQNALLKSLEEPPEGIIFFLITPFKDKLLSTIRSRCWSIDFSPLKESEIIQAVKKYYPDFEDSLVKKAAHFADGSVVKAVNLLENDIDELLEIAITILRYSLGRRYNTSINTLDKVATDYSVETYKSVVILILKWFDDILKEKSKNEGVFFKDYSETLVKFNKNFPKADILKAVTNIERLISSMDANIHLNVITANIIFEIASLSFRT